MTLHVWVKMWLPPPTSIHKADYLPDQPKPSLILPFLLLQPYSALRNSRTAPWAPDERPREMTARLVISAPGCSHYICWPAGLCARQSPGPRMGRSRGGLVLPGLEENTSTKSLTHPPNSPLSRYITSEVCMLQSTCLNFSPQRFILMFAVLPSLCYHLSCNITSYSSMVLPLHCFKF